MFRSAGRMLSVGSGRSLWSTVGARAGAGAGAGSLVTLTKDGDAATVSLNAPPVNPLSLGLLSELSEALGQVAADKSIKGAVLTSSNPGVFSAGLDLTALAGVTEASATEFWGTLQSAWLALYGNPKPIVAAINGHAPAGGCLLSISCDHRVMAGDKGFSIGLNETQLGIVAPTWFAAPFVHLIGQREAERHLSLGTMLSTEQAQELGLVDDVVPLADVSDKAHEVLAQYMAIPSQARAITKAMLRKPTIDATIGTPEGKAADLKIFLDIILSEPVQQSLAMYLQALAQKKNK